MREGNKTKLELMSGRNIYAIELDADHRVFVAVVTDAYPMRHIFSGGAPGARLMVDFKSHVLQNFTHESLSSPEKGLRKSVRR